jgi:hypothetical protein
MNYELGHLDMNGNKNSTNGHVNATNGKSAKNGTNNSNGHLKNGASSADSITNDILPSNDDEVKRWSCDMDSNILF